MAALPSTRLGIRGRATADECRRRWTASWTFLLPRPRGVRKGTPGAAGPALHYRPPRPVTPTSRGDHMAHVLRVVLAELGLAALALGVLAAPALAQTTTLTMSSWVSPQHHITAVVLQGWATEVEKATSGRVKFTMLPKHPSAAPGTFDAVRDGLVDLSFVTASYTPARHILPLMPELPGSGETAL